MRDYLATLRKPKILNAGVSAVKADTMGPEGRYSAVLFLEKEGFTQILEAARIAERYDLAIMSTKGMSVTAARILVEELCGRRGLPLFVLHDFDLAGFSIKQTLVTSNRRHHFRHPINFTDLGLRLKDVQELELEAEDFSFRESEDALAHRLRINGATPEEIAFLLDGERVELNAMPSDQFVAFVERKLDENGVAKVIPSAEMLAEAFTTFKRGRLAYAALKAELERLNKEPVDVPADLEKRVKAHLVENPAETWDAAVKAIIDGGDDSESGDGDA